VISMKTLMAGVATLTIVLGLGGLRMPAAEAG